MVHNFAKVPFFFLGEKKKLRLPFAGLSKNDLRAAIRLLELISASPRLEMKDVEKDVARFSIKGKGKK